MMGRQPIRVKPKRASQEDRTVDAYSGQHNEMWIDRSTIILTQREVDIDGKVIKLVEQNELPQ